MRTYRPTGLILSLCLLASAGCGYRNLALQHRGASVYFPVMRNNTMEPGAELMLSNAIREEILRAGIALAGEENSDWLLHGTVTGYERKPYSYTRSEDARRWRRAHLYRLSVTARMTLTISAPSEGEKDARQKETVLTETLTYFLDGPYARTEAEAFNLLAGNLAKRTVEWLTDY